MIIQSETIFQWVVTLVIGALTWLGGVAVRNNRERFTSVDEKTKDVEHRVSKLEDRINNKLPEELQKLNDQVRTLEGTINTVNTKVEIISNTVIARVDRLEENLPSLIESTLYKIMANGKIALLKDNSNSNGRD